MHSRYWIFGWIVSIALHGAVLVLLLSGGLLSRASKDDAPSASEPSADTNEAAFAESEVPPEAEKPSPVSASEPAARPEVAPVVKTEPRRAQPSKKVKKEQEKKEPEKKEPEKKGPEKKEPEKRAWATYVVRRGDTLAALVKRTGVSATEIARKNKKTVTYLSKLKVGQRLLLPVDKADGAL